MSLPSPFTGAYYPAQRQDFNGPRHDARSRGPRVASASHDRGTHYRLQAMAQEYARRLQAEGFSVEQGLAAFQQCTRQLPTGAANAGEAEVRQIEETARRLFAEGWIEWFKEPCSLLGSECPADLMRTGVGRAKVRSLLRAYDAAS